MPEERRLHLRYRVTYELRGKALTPVDACGAALFAADQEICGEIPDISAGGLCLLTDDKVEVSDAVRCEIFVPDEPIGIPALLNVRWSGPSGGRYLYRLGLEFLI